MKKMYFILILLASCSGNVSNEKITGTRVPGRPTCKYNLSAEKPACQVCLKDDKVVPYVYGLPTRQAMEDEQQGKLRLGGCEEDSCGPRWFCKRDSVDVLLVKEPGI